MKAYNRSDFNRIRDFYAQAEEDGYMIIVSEMADKPECYGLDEISELRDLNFIKKWNAAGLEISIADDLIINHKDRVNFIMGEYKEEGNAYIKKAIGWIKVKSLIIKSVKKIDENI